MIWRMILDGTLLALALIVASLILTVVILVLTIKKEVRLRGAIKIVLGQLGTPVLSWQCKRRYRADERHITPYKWAYPVVIQGETRFFPLRMRYANYASEAVAQCSHGGLSESLICGCGFHAVKLRAHLGYVEGSYPKPKGLYQQGFCATLEVDLHGNVFSGRVGFRAEKQRVLQVMMPQYCWFHFRAITSNHRRIVPAEGLTIVGEIAIVPTCQACTEKLYPLSWLAQSLQTEVVWDSERPVI
jgi:hypothetical protein